MWCWAYIGFETKRADDFLGWAPDFPAEATGEAITAWLTGHRYREAAQADLPGDRAFPRDFVEQFVPEWFLLIERAVAHARRQMKPQGRP